MTLQVFYKRTRNTVPVKFSTFPGGEEYVLVEASEKDIDENGQDVIVEARITSSQDLIRYILLANALSSVGLQVLTFMPYFPYARQDRICRRGESNSLAIVDSIFSKYHPTQRIRIVDLHSDAVVERWDASVKQHDIFNQLFHNFKMHEKDFVLVAPDKGASNKIKHCAFITGREYAVCDKVRNASGVVEGVKITERENLVSGRNCLIVDDICDGGATFIGTAKALLEAGAKSVSLYVTHGIFSKGFGPLEPYFENIYTTNSFFPRYVGKYNEMQVHVFDVFNYLWEINDVHA